VILLDTTILVYAVGDDHPLRDPCRRLINAIGAGRVEATTTVEVVQELLHVRARRRGRADAAATARAYSILLAPLRTVTEEDLRRGLDLYAGVEALGAFDAVLAATAVGAAPITGLASADRAFAAVPGLVHHDPAVADFDERLGLD